MGDIRRATEAIAGSTALAAISRIGIPLLLAVVGWAATVVVGLERRVAVLESGRAAVNEDLGRRLTAIEVTDQRDRETLTQLRSDVAALLANQAATLRALDRLERAVERRDPR